MQIIVFAALQLIGFKVFDFYVPVIIGFRDNCDTINILRKPICLQLFSLLSFKRKSQSTKCTHV